MTTLLRPAAGGRAKEVPEPEASPAKPRTPAGLRRNRSRIGMGLVVIALSVLGTVALVSRSAQRQQVLALVREVPAGAAITDADLTTVELPLDTGLPVIASADSAKVLGQVAAGTLPGGTLLHRSHLAPHVRIPEGMALLGAVLEAGEYPVGLREGDEVRLIAAPGPSADAGNPGVADLGVGEVRELAEPPTGSAALVVSLLVPGDSAAAISAAGGEGRISLVVIGER